MLKENYIMQKGYFIYNNRKLIYSWHCMAECIDMSLADHLHITCTLCRRSSHTDHSLGKLGERNRDV
jgi:hypothetical protein